MIYNTTKAAFDAALKREQHIIYDYWTKKEYSCFFRRKDDSQIGSSNLIIYHPVSEGIHEGTLLSYKGKTYLVKSQETAENSIYRKSILLETNTKIQTISDGLEIIVPAYASNLSSPFPVDGKYLSMMGGQLKLITKSNQYTNNLAVNNKFYALGNYYKIENTCSKQGILTIFAEQQAIPTRQTEYSLSFSPATEYASGIVQALKATAYANSEEIKNATLEWSTSDNRVVAITENGNAQFIGLGTAVIYVRWLEHDITTSATVQVVVENDNEFCEITYSGDSCLFIGAATKTFTAKFFDTQGLQDETITPVWNLELIPSQEGKVTIAEQIENKIKLKVEPRSKGITGTEFILWLSSEDDRYNCSLKITIWEV